MSYLWIPFFLFSSFFLNLLFYSFIQLHFLNYQSFGKHTSSEINGEAVLRHIHGLTENASLSIREIAGPSTKFSLSHSWTFDSRDEKSIPSKGGYLRTYNVSILPTRQYIFIVFGMLILVRPPPTLSPFHSLSFRVCMWVVGVWIMIIRNQPL